MTETTFTVTGTDHGLETNESTVTFGDQITVEGTIVGSDGGKTAALSAVVIDDAGTLTVTIETVPDENASPFVTQALLGIQYRIEIQTDRQAERVRIEHSGVDEWTATYTQA
ncbi:hypothetical protein [Halorhabdus rudnickae]|uniref:hypothetical protein n=1 Tax=Halorhabdus rudnickae TaxID=1775544 RepID=UPI0010835F55|nr:hypothetical protein [Halorhabdus rudnickae]